MAQTRQNAHVIAGPQPRANRAKRRAPRRVP
jgi:hypothetical protein